MAVVRARSAPPYALISFIALWVISTVLAVLFYLQATKASQALADREKDLNNIATASERAGVGTRILNENANKKVSILAAAAQQIDELKAAITGDKNAPFAIVIDRAKAAQAAAGGSQPLATAVNTLVASRNSTANTLKSVQTTLEGLNAQVAEREKQGADRFNAAQASIEDLRKQLGEANDTLAKVRDQMAQEVAKAQQEITEANEKNEANNRANVLAAQAKDAQINKLENSITELRQRLINMGTDANPKVGEPDGTVVRVNPADKEVYIDLHGPRIKEGLTFTVYDPRTGVRFGNDEEAQGKGSIEVIQPGDPLTLCRITRTTHGQNIAQGDLISNVVFQLNKNRKYHFVIIGNFDLDGDGVATADERDRLATLVQRTDGIIDNDVTSQTDYLIVGTKPASASIAPTTEPATEGSATSQRGVEQNQYDQMIIEAKRLSIPVLNANRFLNMIGYYSTTIVRH